MLNEKPMDRKALLSTLWIFTVLNYIHGAFVLPSEPVEALRRLEKEIA